MEFFPYLNPLLRYRIICQEEEKEIGENIESHTDCKIVLEKFTPEEMDEKNRLKALLDPKVKQLIDYLKKNPNILGQRTEISFNRTQTTNGTMPHLLNYLQIKHPAYKFSTLDDDVYVSRRFWGVANSRFS